MTDPILKIIAENQNLANALKVHLKEYFSLADLGTNYPDEHLGQMARARLWGLDRIEIAFKEIEKLKNVRIQTPVQNPAR